MASTLSVLNGPGINQLRSCAAMALDLAIDEECTTDGCVCQDLPSILHAVSTGVDGYCSSNKYDATTAMVAVISYCTVHGYAVPSDLASITTSSGAFDVLSILMVIDGTLSSC